MSTLNDKEVAVIIDSLAAMRDLIEDEGSVETPNIDSALAKIYAFVTPASSEIRLVPIKAEPLSNLDKIAFEFAAEMEMEQSNSGRHVDLDSLMRRWAAGGFRVTIESLDFNPDLEVDAEDLAAAWEDPKVQTVLTNATESYECSVREGRRI